MLQNDKICTAKPSAKVKHECKQKQWCMCNELFISYVHLAYKKLHLKTVILIENVTYMPVCKLDQSQVSSSNNGKSFCGGVYSELLYLNSKFEAYSVSSRV